jgi:uncharacterized protein YggE
MRVLSSTLAILLPMALAAQSGTPMAPPQVTTTGTAEVEVRPDRATLVLTVEARGSTAAKAGAEAARRQRGVIDTLKAMGVANEQVSTASVDISPEYVYPGQNQPPRVTGYVARNSIRIEVLKIDQVGALIDAGLSKEATGIGSLMFSSSKTEELRRQALTAAVARAKGDADAIARAAGGTLGDLLELSAQPLYDRPVPMAASGMLKEARSSMAQTPIEPGQLRISATVNARWMFKER